MINHLKNKFPVSNKLVLSLIILLGGALRIFHLGAESLTFDEIYSIKLTKMSFSMIIDETSRDFHPPLYYFLLKLWAGLFGADEFAGRLLSAIFGIAAILMIFYIARHLFNEKTALTASFLLAVSHLNIQFSQEARMYSQMVLLTICAMYYLLKLPERRSLSDFLIFTILNVLLLYTHVYSFFIISAESAYFFSLYFFDKETFSKCLRRFTYSIICMALLYLPWFVIFLRQFLSAQRFLWIPETGILGFPEILAEYSGSILLAIIFIPLFFLAFFSINLSHKTDYQKNIFSKLEGLRINIGFINSRKLFFLLLWLILPVLLPYIISKILSPIFLMKYTIAASTAFLLFIAAGIDNIKSAGIKVAVILLICILTLINQKNEYMANKKETWKEAVTYLDKAVKPDDLIMFNSGNCIDLYNYYTKRTDTHKYPLYLRWNQLNRDTLTSVITPLFKKHNRFWLVVSHTFDSNEEVRKALYNLTDSSSGVQFYSNYRRYFFLQSYNPRSFDIFLLKTYYSPDIAIYFYEKHNRSNMNAEWKPVAGNSLQKTKVKSVK
ncbi:MAG: glycosyltransferase family 39 protein [Ignavibacteria bacterium]